MTPKHTPKTTSQAETQPVIIEDECDLQIYDKALADFYADPETYSIDEVEKELGLL